MQTANPLIDACAQLNKNSVRFLIVGGVALSLHGIKRQTHDIDIWIGSDSANCKNFLTFLGNLPTSYFGFDASSLFPNGILDDCVHVLRLLNSAKIDFRLRCDGCEFDTCYQRRIIHNSSLPIASLSDLIIMKRIGAQWRAVDRFDLVALQYLKEAEAIMAGPRISKLKNGEIAVYEASRGELVILSASEQKRWDTSKKSIDDAIAIADAGGGYRVDRSKLRTLLEAMGTSVLLS